VVYVKKSVMSRSSIKSWSWISFSLYVANLLHYTNGNCAGLI